MNTLEMLETLARTIVTSEDLEVCFNSMNSEVRNAYILNDMDALKQHLSQDRLYANEVAVTSIS